MDSKIQVIWKRGSKMPDVEEKSRVILQEASKLSVENQRYILAVMKGMLFTKKCLLNCKISINKEG